MILAAFCVTLAACVPQAPEPAQSNFRPKGGQVYTSAAFEHARLPGRWAQVAGFGPKTDCKPGGVDIGPDGTTAFRLCLGGKTVKGAGKLQPTGPGRFAVAGQEWFVLWVDGDYRTLAIGTPSGAFGFVLNRGGKISGDRMTAAREIFDWNGYDTAAFRPL